MLGIDISNYSDPLTPDALQAWKDAGLGLVLVQAVDPPPGYPAGRTRAQIQACLDAGLTVDAYIWQWYDLPSSDIERKLALLDGLAVRQLWLDEEDTSAIKYSQSDLEQSIQAARDICDNWQVSRGQYVADGPRARKPINPTGIYTGRWFWVDPRYMANSTAFSDCELWDANYDNVVDAALGFVPYGGWSGARIKQYHGTTSLAGIGGVDLDVLSVAEEAEIDGQPDQPQPSDYDVAWQARKGEIVGLAGELVTVADQIQAAGSRKGGPIKSQVLPLADAVRSRANRILAG